VSNWLQKVSHPLQPGYEEYSQEELSNIDPGLSRDFAGEMLAEHTARSIDKPPFKGVIQTGRETIYIMDIRDETFLQFTKPKEAQAIVNDGYLRFIKGMDRPGILALCGISLTYGKFFPSVQTAHIGSTGELVAVIFKTNSVP